VASGSAKRRRTVCVFLTHPLVAQQFEELLDGGHWLLRVQNLETPWITKLSELNVPAASAFVLDAHGPQQAVQALVAHILNKRPDAPVIVLAEKLNEASGFPLLRSGVRGLLTFEQAREQLPKALGSVTNGGYWVPRAILARFVNSILRQGKPRVTSILPGQLSRREQEVLDVLLKNLSNKEIASQLFISERTAKFHVSNLLAKFNVRRRADLIMLHFQQGQRSA
jgi:DNA-binding NarL/FixJ family response regulator